MSVRDDIAGWSTTARKPDGTAYTFGELPLLLQSLMLFDASLYQLAAGLPLPERRHVASFLRDLADIVEAPDPLVYRRRHDTRFLDECVGHA